MVTDQVSEIIDFDDISLDDCGFFLRLMGNHIQNEGLFALLFDRLLDIAHNSTGGAQGRSTEVLHRRAH